MRWTAWTTVAAVLLSLARGVSAQQAPPAADPEVFYPFPIVKAWADLEFVRERSASVCPGEQWMRDLMGARMGSETFKPNPRGVYVGRVRVVMSRAPGGFAAAYTWVDAKGVEHHERFVLPGDTWWHCREAMEYAVTALSVDFDSIERDVGAKYARKTPSPYCPAVPPPASTPCPPPLPDSRFAIWPTEWPLPPLEKPKPDPPAPPERWPIAVRLGATVTPELIANGWGSTGFAVDAGARYRWASLSVEAHGDPPLGSDVYQGVGAVSFARLSGGLRFCAVWGWFVGCGVGDAGRFIFPNHVSALPASVNYFTAGVSAGFELPIGAPWIFLRVGLDLRAPIDPPSYNPHGTTIFQAAGPSVGFGLGIVAELPL